MLALIGLVLTVTLYRLTSKRLQPTERGRHCY